MLVKANLGNEEIEALYAKYLDAKVKLLTALNRETIEIVEKETASKS